MNQRGIHSVSEPRYSHAYTLAFEIESNHEFGDDVTAAQMRAGIINHLEGMTSDELMTNTSAPFDTYEVGT